MNLLKCDKCGNRNVTCFLCEKNSHYRETKYSHDNLIRNKAIDEFAERLKEKAENLEMSISVFGGNNGKVISATIDEIAESMKEGAE